MRTSLALLSFAALTTLPIIASAGEAHAEPDGVARPSSFVSDYHPGVGVRVGGYGFRNPSTGKWDDCRMNGVGLFGTLNFGKHLFVETGLDSYQAAPGAEMGQDRVSIAGTAAGGVRMFPDFVLTPNVHLGGGAEWTRVDAPGGRLEGMYPVGFFGVGLEANLHASLKLGANLRILALSHPREQMAEAPKPLGGVAEPAPQMEWAMASQAQLFVRYVM